MYVTISGYCPTQNSSFSVSAKLIYKEDKKVGLVECEYIRNGGTCSQNKCPIVKQNGYIQ